MMTPRSDEMMETKYSDQSSHSYLDNHKSLLLPLPTKTEVRNIVVVLK